MKKGLLLSSLLLLSACKGDVPKLGVINNYDENVSFFDITASEVISRIDIKDSFWLYYYSSTCSSCEKETKVLTTYLEETHYSMYRVDVTVTEIELLRKYHPEIFAKIDTPTLMIFIDGSLTYTFNANELEKLSTFKSRIKNRIQETKATTLSTLKSFKKYNSNTKDYLFFVYDSAAPFSYEFYLYHMQNYVIKEKNKSTLLIDLNQIKNQQLASFYSEIDLTGPESHFYLIEVKNASCDTYINYITNTEQAIEILSNYYSVD